MSQEIVQKSVIKNAAYIFFIKLFPAIATVAVFILYSKYLSKEDYSDYQNFWYKLLLLGTFAYAGLPVVIITYSIDVIKYLSRQIKKQQIVFYSLWLLSLTMLFAFLTQHDLHVSLWLSAGLILSYAIYTVQESLLIAAKRMNELVFMNLFYGVYFLFIHIQALSNYHLEDLLTWLLLGMVIRSGLLFFIIQKIYKQTATIDMQEGVIAKARNLWMHLGIYDLLQNIFRFIDKFILAYFFTKSLYAVYVNGAIEIPFLPYLLGAIGSSILVQLASGNKASNNQPQLLLLESSKLLSNIVFPLFFFLLFYAKELIVLLFSEKYINAVPVFITFLFVLPLRSYSYTTILQHFHKGAIINKGAVLDLIIALCLMYPLYQLLGLAGIALSFVLSTYIQVLYYLHHSARILNVKLHSLLPLKNWFVKFFMFGIMIFFFYQFTSRFLTSQYLLIAGAIISFMISLLFFVYEIKQKKPVIN